ncbi:hypothetical protein EYF80_043413 [Liparis tanakae]|uniref:Uncharacterized protein n=1 Tax=Liparis tanakae TaxID=230148 RepID=A0A4Z2FZR2_9TELE|nr:hypothetical protein EYF80_043413 [Liparis tanakae]
MCRPHRGGIKRSPGVLLYFDIQDLRVFKAETDDVEVDSGPQQPHEEAATSEVLVAGPGLEEWAATCPCGLAARPPVLRQRPRSTLWKAFLNSRLKHG